MVLLGQRMGAGNGGHEGLVVQRRQRQAGVGEGLGDDGAVDLAGAQHLQQLDGVVLLQHQRHLRRAHDGVAHQVRQQVGADGVDHTQGEHAGQRVLAALGDFLDLGGLLQHALRLTDDLLAQRRDRHFAGTALEELDIELLLQLLDRHGQRGLGHITGFGGAAKMLFTCHGHDVFEFGKCHWRAVTGREPRKMRWSYTKNLCRNLCAIRPCGRLAGVLPSKVPAQVLGFVLIRLCQSSSAHDHCALPDPPAFCIYPPSATAGASGRVAA